MLFRSLDGEVAAWLRPEQAFPGPEELVRAMRADVDAARAHLTALGAPGD